MSDTELATSKMADQVGVICETVDEVGSSNKIGDAESHSQTCESTDAEESLSLEEKSEPDLFNVDQPIQYSSDEESDGENLNSNKDKGKVVQESNSESNANSSSSESESVESEDEDEDDSDVEAKNTVYEDDDEEVNEGENDEPIKSKNEILDSRVPCLPENYTVDDKTNIQFIGNVSGVVEKNVIITAAKSAEDRVLNEGTVLCFEDRTPVGLLYEVFGRLQSPVYSVKFNTQEEAEKFRGKKGSKVFFVVPTAEFLSTHQIRKFKGSDASNCNDEELPEDEQEFSDDEKEAAAKKKKKRKKRQSTATSNSVENGPTKNHSEDENELPEAKRQKQEYSTPKQAKPPGGVPISVRARLTSLPSKAKTPAQTNYSAQQNNDVNPMKMMQQFMSMVQQVSNSSAPSPTYSDSRNQYPSQYQQPAQVNSQYSPTYNPQYNPQYHSLDTQPNMQYSQQYTQQYHPFYNQQFNQQTASQTFSQFANSGVAYNQPVYPQQYPPPNITNSPHVYTEPQNSNSSANTALLVAQLAAAITNTAHNSASSFQQGDEQSPLPANNIGTNHKAENDEDYDPAV